MKFVYVVTSSQFFFLATEDFSGPIVTQFNAYCFHLVLRDATLVQSPAGRNFQPVYGINANPGIKKTTDLWR